MNEVKAQEFITNNPEGNFQYLADAETIALRERVRAQFENAPAAYQEDYEARCREALEILIDWANGSMSQLGKVAGYSTPTVMYWVKTGRVSKSGAVRIAEFPGVPLTKEQIRPDIKIWD